MKLNPAVAGLAFPRIPAVAQWMADYDGSQGPPIDLSQAVPGYPPPRELLGWLGEAAADPAMTGYGEIEGEAVLREAYAAHLSYSYAAPLGADNVHITSGCNQAFVAALIAIAGQGDRVLMTTPFYFNHESTLAMLGIGSRFIAVDPQREFLPDVGELRRALDGVRALALVSPNNPTGTVYPAALLEQVFDACREAGAWLLLDETYRDFCGERHGLFARENWQDTLVQLYSFSKAYCIPGHRLGAIAAGKPLIDAVAKIMDNLQICAPRAPQVAVARAIEPLAAWRADNAAEIDRRASALRATLARVEDWQIAAMGAYFAYVRHPFEALGSEQVARQLAQQMGIACLPGEFFGEGQESFLRVAFANVDADTIAGLADRLRRFRPRQAGLPPA